MVMFGSLQRGDHCAAGLGDVRWFHDADHRTHFAWDPHQQQQCGYTRFSGPSGGYEATVKLLRGRRIAFLGNSVLYRLLLTVEAFALHAARSMSVFAPSVRISSNVLPTWRNDLPDFHHGTLLHVIGARQTLSHRGGCLNRTNGLAGHEVVSRGCGPCVNTSGATTSLTFAYGDTPPEPAVHSWLRAWAAMEQAGLPAAAGGGDFGGAGHGCHQPSIVESDVVVVQQTSAHGWEGGGGLLSTLGRLQSALRRRRKAVTFVLLSPTDVSAPPTGWEERGDARCRPTSHLDEAEEALLHHVKQARTSTLHSAQSPAGSLEMKCVTCRAAGAGPGRDRRARLARHRRGHRRQAAAARARLRVALHRPWPPLPRRGDPQRPTAVPRHRGGQR